MTEWTHGNSTPWNNTQQEKQAKDERRGQAEKTQMHNLSTVGLFLNETAEKAKLIYSGRGQSSQKWKAPEMHCEEDFEDDKNVLSSCW